MKRSLLCVVSPLILQWMLTFFWLCCGSCQELCLTPSTRSKVSTDGPDDDSQQGPEHTEARPRADRSSFAGCNDADLAQTAAQSPGMTLQISSRQQTSLREREKRARTAPHSKDRQPWSRCQTCLKHESGKRANGSTEASPPTATCEARSAKTAAFSRKTVHSNK